MSVDMTMDERNGKPVPAGGAAGKSSRVTVYTPSSAGAVHSTDAVPDDALPCAIVFPRQVQRSQGSVPSPVGEVGR